MTDYRIARVRETDGYKSWFVFGIAAGIILMYIVSLV